MYRIPIGAVNEMTGNLFLAFAQKVICRPGRMRVATCSFVAALSLCLSVLVGPAWAGAGGLDSAFGVGGITTTPLETAPRVRIEFGVGPDGSVVVGEPSSYLLRLGSSGAVDPAFGDGGKLSLTPDPIAEGVLGRLLGSSNFVVDGAGRLLVFGDQSDPSHTYPIPNTTENQVATESEAVVLRFGQDGRLDPSFGGGRGFVRSSFGMQSALHPGFPSTDAIVGGVDSKNRPVFVVGGAAIELGCRAGSVTYYPLGLVRLTEAGEMDRHFGGSGIAPISGSTGSPGLGIDSAARPALGLGHFPRPSVACHPATALARLGANGRPLGSFGSNGIATLKRNLSFDFVTPSGAMVLGHRSGRTLEVVRIGLSGRPDTGFGDDGVARVRLPGPGAHVRPVGVDGKGRIVLAGVVGANGAFPVQSSNIAKPPTLAVGRLLRDGRLDRSLGTGGWILDRVPGANEIGVNTAALDPQGRLLLAATVTAPGQSQGGYLLARFVLGK
jgi:uncharacterized delta-60 repeat protein